MPRAWPLIGEGGTSTPLDRLGAVEGGTGTPLDRLAAVEGGSPPDRLAAAQGGTPPDRLIACRSRGGHPARPPEHLAAAQGGTPPDRLAACRPLLWLAGQGGCPPVLRQGGQGVPLRHARASLRESQPPATARGGGCHNMRAELSCCVLFSIFLHAVSCMCTAPFLSLSLSLSWMSAVQADTGRQQRSGTGRASQHTGSPDAEAKKKGGPDYPGECWSIHPVTCSAADDHRVLQHLDLVRPPGRLRVGPTNFKECWLKKVGLEDIIPN